MNTRTKLLLCALATALALSAAVATANARRFEFSDQHFRVVWPSEGKLTFAEEANGINTGVACEIEIEGSFHSRTISKVSGQLVGYVTKAIVNHASCIRGDAWTLNGVEEIGGVRTGNTLPWHIRYRSFVGTLPRISEVKLQIIGLSYLAELRRESFIIRCLFLSDAVKPALFILNVEGGGNANTLTAEPITPVPVHARLEPAPILCPAEDFLLGTGNVTVQGSSTTKIRVRLVQ